MIGEDQLLDADAVLVSDEGKADLILKDLEFVETRLGRDPEADRTRGAGKNQVLAGK